MTGARNKFGVLISTLITTFSLGMSAPALAFVNPSPPEHTAEPASQYQAFPVPQGMRHQVVFWQQVYTNWDKHHVALHDMRHMQLIYDVLEVPGEVGDSLTPAQKEWVQDQRDAWSKRLRRIALLADNPDAMDEADRALLNQIKQVAGPAGVADAHEHLRSQRGLRSRFLRGLEMSGRYDSAFRDIFREAGLPEELAYLPHVESSFQNHARSSVGAAGMWQFMPPTGRVYLTMNKAVDERMDPIAAARGAARYLGRAHGVLGDWALAVTSYNHGVAGMARARSEFGADFDRIVREYRSPSFGFASRNFYAQFLAAREVANDPLRFFPEGVNYEAPLALERLVLERPIKARDLAQRYKVSLEELAQINPAWNPKTQKNQVALPSGVAVWLPPGSLAGKPARSSTMAVAQQRPAVSAGGTLHTVQANESLYSIAKKYGLSLAQLRSLNGFSGDTHLLRPGQQLRVRGAEERGGDGVYHVVRKGDSPYLIASNYGVSLKQLLDNNQLTHRSVIRPGQRLAIPVM